MTLTHPQRVKRLYKTILRLHRGLPPELRVLGTEYTKSEFKMHKTCTPHEAEIFVNEWSVYAVTLAEQLGLRGPVTAKPIGSELNIDDLDKFREEQIQQLYELKLAAERKEQDGQ